MNKQSEYCCINNMNIDYEYCCIKIWKALETSFRWNFVQ